MKDEYSLQGVTLVIIFVLTQLLRQIAKAENRYIYNKYRLLIQNRKVKLIECVRISPGLQFIYFWTL